MPTTIFDWIMRTAMLAMAGLVTLSILGAIATMTNDTGTGFAGGERTLIEPRPAKDREAAQAPPAPAASGEGNVAATASAQGQSGIIVAPPPPREDKVAQSLEGIAYALLALAGVGALAVLLLWSIVRELRRIGRPPT